MSSEADDDLEVASFAPARGNPEEARAGTLKPLSLRVCELPNQRSRLETAIATAPSTLRSSPALDMSTDPSWRVSTAAVGLVL